MVYVILVGRRVRSLQVLGRVVGLVENAFECADERGEGAVGDWSGFERGIFTSVGVDDIIVAAIELVLAVLVVCVGAIIFVA